MFIFKELKPILEEIVEELGLSESETFRHAFIEYANKYRLIAKRLKR